MPGRLRVDEGDLRMNHVNYLAIFFGSLAVLAAVYLVFCFFRMLQAPAIRRDAKAILNDNTQAMHENSVLLKELIAVNRQLLDKQNQGNS